uniref:Spindle apparatus coiled-coil protein 1 n=1 Tax=Sinocyclocheilus anshuiensis TaxID=1608454 RepID=A0A671MVU0_9TELE
MIQRRAITFVNTTLQRQLQRLTEEKEEREKEAVSCHNALEKAREANQDLQIQLEQVLQQAQDPNSKGNSLFSEVEDKRSLQKQHALTKQHMHCMKMQIATLMQLQGNRADPAQLERSQFMLSEKNKEIESLMMKVRELEKEKVSFTYYTDLLKMQLSNSKKDAEKLKDELSMARMKALSESQRVLELERKLYGTEQALKQRHSDNMRLQVKLEELKMKYTPNEVNKAQVQKCRREKFPVPVPEEKSESSKEETTTMDTEPSKGSRENTEGETLSHPIEKLVVIPLQSAQPTEPNPRELPRESKSVRICEDPPLCIPDAPRSVPTSACQPFSFLLRCRKKYQQPTHVNSEKTMANECTQQ